MDFGLKELRRLRDTIGEIAEANGISSLLAVWKFFVDVEEQYDAKLGFELKLEDLKSEIKNDELEREATYNQSSGFNWSSLLAGQFQRGEARQREVKSDDKLQQTPVTSSHQQVKIKGANTNEFDSGSLSQTTSFNVDTSKTNNSNLVGCKSQGKEEELEEKGEHGIIEQFNLASNKLTFIDSLVEQQLNLAKQQDNTMNQAELENIRSEIRKQQATILKRISNYKEFVGCNTSPPSAGEQKALK